MKPHINKLARSTYQKALDALSTFLFLSSYRLWRSRYISSSPIGPWRLAYDIISPGPVGPQVLPVDGFDRQCDWSHHDTHTAMPVSPQTAVGLPHCARPTDRCVHTEPGGHLQWVWSDMFSETTGGRAVGWVGGWRASWICRTDNCNKLCCIFFGMKYGVAWLVLKDNKQCPNYPWVSYADKLNRMNGNTLKEIWKDVTIT